MAVKMDGMWQRSIVLNCDVSPTIPGDSQTIVVLWQGVGVVLEVRKGWPIPVNVDGKAIDLPEDALRCVHGQIEKDRS